MVGPFLNSVSISFIFLIVSEKGAAIGPGLCADTILHPLFILSFETEEVYMRGHSLAMVQIISPFALV